MRIATGRVISGKVVFEGEPLEEGAIVTVIAAEDDEAFEFDLEGERALLASIDEAERGETLDGGQVLRQLDNRD